jgi:DNA-binding transcriptional LysR family regulator
MLDLVRLQTLAAVVERGSFSAAARALHITQPAVSRQIALLERHLHARLLVRGRGGVRPTPAGRLLLDHVAAVVDRLTLAEAQVRALQGIPSGTVRLGSFFSALVRLSAEVATVVGERHPDLHIRDDLVDRDTAYRKLGRGELDLAIVFDHDFAPAPIPETVRVHPLFDDPVRIMLPADHPRAQATVTPADLAHDTWILAHDGSAADLVERVLTRHRLDPPRLLAGHGDEPVEIQALVAAGRGVTLTHELTVVVRQDNLVTRPLTGESGVRHIRVAGPAGRLTTAAETVLATVQAVGEQHRTLLAQPGSSPRENPEHVSSSTDAEGRYR